MPLVSQSNILVSNWKWAKGVAASGYEVKLFSLTPYSQEELPENGVEVHSYSSNPKNKFMYPFALGELKDLIKEFKPDIIHAHYASSYGLLGALSRFHPFVISVWGSDVYEFPRKNLLQKGILKFNFKKADKICSTSHTMAKEIKKYTNKDIEVIPFGVDLDIFKPFSVHHVFDNDAIVIGTVKSLETGYGIEYLIDAFSKLQTRLKNHSIKLLIVGTGSLEKELKTKVKDMRIEGDTVFTGYIPPSSIPSYHNMLSISVFPSLSESFGVSVVEAMACEKPVIVTDVGGLPEVVENGVTGLIVPPADVRKLSEAMEALVKDEALRARLGKQGRQRVEKLYDWKNNLASMITVYEELLSGKAI